MLRNTKIDLYLVVVKNMMRILRTCKCHWKALLAVLIFSLSRVLSFGNKKKIEYLVTHVALARFTLHIWLLTSQNCNLLCWNKMSNQRGCQLGGTFESWRLHFRDFDGQRLFSGKVAQTLKYIHREPDNLRSGSIFRFALQITLRWARWKDNRAWYKPSTKRLPPTFLIDWHLLNQPTKITSVACFSSMQIFHA